MAWAGRDTTASSESFRRASTIDDMKGAQSGSDFRAHTVSVSCVPCTGLSRLCSRWPALLSWFEPRSCSIKLTSWTSSDHGQFDTGKVALGASSKWSGPAILRRLSAISAARASDIVINIRASERFFNTTRLCTREKRRLGG